MVESMKRDALLQLRVTRKELTRWQAAAHEAGMPLPEMIREAIRRRVETLESRREAPGVA